MLNQEVPPNKIAFIIDGEVVDVLHTDDRLAAIFLSDPEVVDVTEVYRNSPNPDINMTGWTYDGSNFYYAAMPSDTNVQNVTPEEDELARQILENNSQEIPEGNWETLEENS